MLKITISRIGMLVIILSLFSLPLRTNSARLENNVTAQNNFHDFAVALHASVGDNDLSLPILERGLVGYYKMLAENKLKNWGIITIVDFTKSANVPRFFVIDLKTRSLNYKSLSAHGRNSGEEFATSFSNQSSSYKSSLGFYVAAETYTGKHGLSLKLDGCEKTFNDNARARAIVIHSADYVSNNFIEHNGRLGRSLGCPALPQHDYQQVINTIKGGSCLFIYYPDKNYLTRSTYVKSETYLAYFKTRQEWS